MWKHPWIHEIKINLTLLYMITSAKQIRTQNKRRSNDKTSFSTDPLDKPLTVFDKVIDFDEFLQHLEIKLDMYASQKRKILVISLNKLGAFISIDFVPQIINLAIVLENRKTFHFSILCVQYDEKREM